MAVPPTMTGTARLCPKPASTAIIAGVRTAATVSSASRGRDSVTSLGGSGSAMRCTDGWSPHTATST